MPDHLHIVCHDVPYPPEHGGFTDLFYKIKWLHKLGVKIHLHCFTKGRPPAPELERLCFVVKYYKRQMKQMSFRVPFIVSSRRSVELINALAEDDHPVLLEGIHCTWPLMQGSLAGRRVFVRLHNVEHIYYHHLALHEKNAFKKIYYSRESRLLKSWEEKLADRSANWLAVSRRDVHYFQKVLNTPNVHFLPVFTGHEAFSGHGGHGEFCLYHGNLSVNENEAVAEWLIKEVFAGLNVNLMIAGKDPSKELLSLATGKPNIHIIPNPSNSSMKELMNRAQVHVLPSFNETGVKLKVLNALYEGRFVLVNRNAVEGASLEALCYLAENANDFKKQVQQLMKEEFTPVMIRERNEILNGAYNNEMNALHLSSLLFPHYPKPSHPQS